MCIYKLVCPSYEKQVIQAGSVIYIKSILIVLYVYKLYNYAWEPFVSIKQENNDKKSDVANLKRKVSTLRQGHIIICNFNCVESIKRSWDSRKKSLWSPGVYVIIWILLFSPLSTEDRYILMWQKMTTYTYFNAWWNRKVTWMRVGEYWISRPEILINNPLQSIFLAKINHCWWRIDASSKILIWIRIIK